MTQASIVLTARDDTSRAFATLQGSLNDTGRRIEALNGTVRQFLGAAGVVAFTSGIKSAIDELDRLGDTAPKVGLTAQSLAELGYAAKLSGTDTATLESAMGKLSLKMAEAAGGSKEAALLFQTLGIQIKTSSGALKGTDTMLAELANKFKGFADGPERTALAMEVFGKSGKELIPLLLQGSEGIAGLREEFRKLAGDDISEAVAIAGQFNDNLDRLHTSSLGFARTIIEAAGPALNEIISGFTSANEKGEKFSVVGEGLRIILETVAITGANVAYVFQTIGSNIGGLLALVTAEGSLKDSIYASMQADDQARRKALDSYEQRILKARELAKANAAAASAGDGQAKKPAPVVTKPDPSAQKEYDQILASIEKRGSLIRQELLLGRSLTDAEKFRLEVQEKITGSRSKLTEAQRLQLQLKLKELQADEDQRDKLARRTKEMQAYYQQEQELQDELNADMVRRDQAFDQRLRQAMDYSRAVGESAQYAQVEAQYVHASDTVRAMALDKLALELNLQRQIRDIEADNLLNQEQRAELIAKLTETAQRDIAIAQSRTAVETYRRVYGEISDGLADATIDGLKHGAKSGAQSAIKIIETEFESLVLRPIIKAYLQPVASSVTGLFGAGGSAGGGLAGAANTASSLGNLASLSGSLGSGFGAGLNASLSGGFGTLGLSIEGGMAAIAEGTSASIAAGMGQIAGAVGPYALAAVAAYQLADKLFGSNGGPKTESGYGPGVDITANQESAKLVADSISKSYADLATQLQLSNRDLAVGVRTGIDTVGDSLTQLQVVAQQAGQDVYNRYLRLGGTPGAQENVARGDAALAAAIAEETQRAILAGLQRSDLPANIKALIDGLGDASSLADIQAGISAVTAARSQQLTLEARLYDLTATEADKLAKTRADELAAVNPVNRALLEQIYAQEDLKKALDGATQASTVAASAADSQRLQDLATRRALQGQIDGVVADFNALYNSFQGRSQAVAAATQATLGLTQAEAAQHSATLDFLGQAQQKADALAQAGQAAAGALASVTSAMQAVQADLAGQVALTRLMAGDVSGAMAQLAQANTTSFSGYFDSQGGFNAGAFNEAYARRQAELTMDLGQQLAANVTSTRHLTAAVSAVAGAVASAEGVLKPADLAALATRALPVYNQLASAISANALRLDDFSASLGAAIGGVVSSVQYVNKGTLATLQQAVGSTAYAILNRGNFAQQGVELQNGLGNNLASGPGVLQIRALRAVNAQLDNQITSLQGRAIAAGGILGSLGEAMGRGAISGNAVADSLAFITQSFNGLIQPVLDAATATGSLGATLIDARAQLDTLARRAEAGEFLLTASQIEQRMQGLVSAGVASAGYYFEQLNTLVKEFDATASSVAPAMDDITSAMGRFKSAADVFSESAQAIREGLAGLSGAAAAGLGQGAGLTAGKAEAVASAGDLFASILTSKNAATAQAKLAASGFTPNGDSTLRDISLLLQDLAAFDNEGLSRTYYRLSAALKDNQLTVEQYNQLIGYSQSVYLDSAAAAERSSQAYQQATEKYRKFSDDLRAFINGIAGAADNSGQSFDRLSARFTDLVDAAKRGDDAAFGQISGVGGSLVQALKDSATTGLELDRGLAQIQVAAAEAAAYADQQVSAADQQIALLQSQVSGLDSLNASVLSVRDAVLLSQPQAASAATTLGMPSYAPAYAPVVVPSVAAPATAPAPVDTSGIERRLASLETGLLNALATLASNTGDARDSLTKWDRDGMPAVRT